MIYAKNKAEVEATVREKFNSVIIMTAMTMKMKTVYADSSVEK